MVSQMNQWTRSGNQAEREQGTVGHVMHEVGSGKEVQRSPTAPAPTSATCSYLTYFRESGKFSIAFMKQVRGGRGGSKLGSDGWMMDSSQHC